MTDFNTVSRRLAEMLRRAGVRTLVHLHCEYLAPWQDFDAAGNLHVRNLERVARLTALIARAGGVRASAYVRSPFVLRPGGGYCVNGEAYGFSDLDFADEEMQRAASRHLARAGFELGWWFDAAGLIHGAPDDAALNAFLAAHDTPDANRQRLQLAAEMARYAISRALRQQLKSITMASDRGIDPGLVPGLRLGDCVADFATAGGADQAATVPFVSGPAAPPRFAYGRRPQEQEFFHWAAPAPESGCLDYQPGEASLLSDPQAWGARQIRDMVLIDGTLFLRTYAHSLDAAYFPAGEQPLPPPLLHRDARAAIGCLMDAATTAGLVAERLTASEVLERFASAHHEGDTSLTPPPRTLDAAAEHSQTAEQVLDEALPVLRQAARVAFTKRFERSGARGCGLDEANARSRCNQIFQSREEAVARFLLQRFGDARLFVEFGTGIGGVALMLAASGVPALGLDASRARIGTATHIHNALLRAGVGTSLLGYAADTLPHALSRVHPQAGEVALLVAPMAPAPAAQIEKLVRQLGGFSAVLFDPGLGFLRLPGTDDQARAAAEFARHGLAMTEVEIGLHPYLLASKSPG